jgi:hypothetical protein
VGVFGGTSPFDGVTVCLGGAQTGCGGVTGSLGGEGAGLGLATGNGGLLEVGRISLELGAVPLMVEAGAGVGTAIAGKLGLGGVWSAVANGVRPSD